MGGGSTFFLLIFMINLTFLAAAKITEEPPSVVYSKSGADVFFKWNYEAVKTELKQLAFQWFTFLPAFDQANPKQIYVETKDEVRQLGAETPVSLQGRVGFEGKATLIIRNVSRADNNYYQFVIATRSGDIVSTKTLYVTEPPHVDIGITPQSVTTIKGQNATFTCRVVGKPTPNVTWISLTSNQSLADGEKYSISGTIGNSTLVIGNVSRSDGGGYSCIASNPADEVLKLNFFLTVPYIEIDKNLSKQKAFPRGNNTEPLLCAAIGWPEPTVTWTNKRTNILTEGRSLSVKASDYGNYTCKASNIVGDETLDGMVSEDSLSIGSKETSLNFRRDKDATYYLIKGYMKDELVYLGVGTTNEVRFSWCSFDKTLPGESATILFEVLADGDLTRRLTYVSKMVEKGNSVC